MSNWRRGLCQIRWQSVTEISKSDQGQTLMEREKKNQGWWTKLNRVSTPHFTLFNTVYHRTPMNSKTFHKRTLMTTYTFSYQEQGSSSHTFTKDGQRTNMIISLIQKSSVIQNTSMIIYRVSSPCLLVTFISQFILWYVLCYCGYISGTD